MLMQSLSGRITLAFILINVLIWLAFGGIVVTNAHPALSVPPLIKGIFAFLSFVMALLLAVLLVFLGRRSRTAYFLSLLLFVATILITFFDDVGWVDIFFLLVNVIPFILLIKDRKWYLAKDSRN
jgi:lysylphosphatidylglycerol synthetase-like protein (DUF2156 family)